MNLQQIVDFIFPPQCGGCDEPGTGICERCLPRAAPIALHTATLQVRALAPYDGKLRSAVLALKSGRRDVARSLATRLSEIVAPGAMLVPVPTTAARRRERGFDGCVLMGRDIARASGARVLPYLRQVRGDRQRGRTRGERLAARGRFVWDGEEFPGEEITLLDDVVTTGATLEDCAAAIRAAGGIVAHAVAIAVTP